MDPKRYQRLKELVGQALDLPEYERDVFLQEHCEDAELLAEARDLLHFHATGNEGIPGNVVLSAALPDLINSQVGPYKILEPLGEGGMGVVYLASQSAPLRRKVALKVIKLGMDTREVISRFQSERQALALMDHPNIAKVFDAGATDEGRPYFVMEYIPGVPLTRYCADRKLGLRERLDLFIQVCQGVQHAHQKGIIHRDLKPGNILVTEVEGKAVPKIIDFGVAKATAQNLAAQTLFTLKGQVIGTPEYMSPEQAGSSMADVDTRSDVYTLGVLLYELLTGVLPLERRDIMQAGLERIALHVQNEIPKKPSTRISTRATQSKGAQQAGDRETRMLAKRVRGDLDWITMKALEKEPDRRYGSASDLAADLRRHLEGRAVAAGPPSGVYRMRKFVKRNRVGVGFAATLLVAILGFAAWQTVQSRIIAGERDKAMANERLSLAREKIDKDPTMAMAYALASLEILDQPSARDAVRQALARAPIRNEMPRWGHRGNPLCVDASPDGRYCAVSWSHHEKQTVGIYSLEDYSMGVLEAPSSGHVFESRFNADGSHITALTSDGIHLWRVADGQHLLHLPSFADYTSIFIFRLADPGKMVLCANNSGEPIVWFELNVQDLSFRELGRSLGIQYDQTGHGAIIDPSATWIMDYDGTRVFLQRVADLDTDRSLFVGEHESMVSSVAFDAACETGVSMDVGGRIKVWDLTVSPPRLTREFEEKPGTWNLTFDPYGQRFLTSWGSSTIHVYDLKDKPKRQPVPLLDRTHWAHMGAFLPDGSLVSSGNGTSVVHWESPYPVAWTLDLSDTPGSVPLVTNSRDGRVLYLWYNEGVVMGIPLIEGLSEGIGKLGQTRGWNKGVLGSMIADRQRNRCVAYSYPGGSQILDFQSGKTLDLQGLDGMNILRIFSAGGRYAGFSNLMEEDSFCVFDLDSLRVAYVIDLESTNYEHFCFGGETALLAFDEGHIVRFEFTNPAAQPDTLWQGDASGAGFFLEDGRAAVVQDSERRLSWVDLTEGREIEIGKKTERRLVCADYSPALGLLAVGGWSESIEVFDVEQGKKWILPVPGEGTKYTGQLIFDPLGRWLISRQPNQITAWALPLDPLFGDLEYEELLTSVRALTNVRVLPDESKTNGFRIANATDPDS